MSHDGATMPAGGLRRVLGAALILVASGLPAWAQAPSLDELISAVVRIKTVIKPDGRTVANLGRQRAGSGVVIDGSGLVVTIGYLMVEAQSAEVDTGDGRTVQADVLGYDHESGFGLLKATAPLRVRPIALGKSGELKQGDPVLAASFGGMSGLAPAYVAARREFAGPWEYLLDEAIFTAPAHSDWSGAALINREGKLVGIGSLIVPDASGKGDGVPGNLYVPTDLLTPILADLIARKAPGRKPWLGITTEEVRGRLFVARVAPESPAEQAGLKRGDVIVGVAGEPAKSLADFYRKVWARGAPGVVVPLDVLQDTGVKRIDVRSANRLDHLKLKSAL